MHNVIITTGGTGGHIFPAIACAEVLQRTGTADILFVGSGTGPEKVWAGQAGIPFRGFAVQGFLGRGFRKITAALHMGKAVLSAVGLLREIRPDIVLGFGGYASFAVLCAAQLLGIPTMLHEQNAIAGVANRLMGRRAKAVCLSLADTEGFAKEKCVHTGNPVRNRIATAHPKDDFSQRHLLILGGSQGAHALNRFVVEHLKDFRAAGVSLIHQTGRQDEARVKEAYSAAGYDAGNVHAFHDRMEELYGWADLVLCRAGASTIAELCVLGVPAVFVPFPHAVHDHQTRNAEVLKNAGCAELIPEDRLSDDSLGVICGLLGSPGTLSSMHADMLRLARPDAAADVIRVMEAVLAGDAPSARRD